MKSGGSIWAKKFQIKTSGLRYFSSHSLSSHVFLGLCVAIHCKFDYFTPSLLRAGCARNLSVESLHNLELDITGDFQTLLKTAQVTSTLELNENSWMKPSKNPLLTLPDGLLNCTRRTWTVNKSVAIKIDQLKTEHIEKQKKLMQMQEMKIDSVHWTVKTSLKSCAGIAKQGIASKAVTANTVKEADQWMIDDAFLFMVLRKMMMKHLVP